MEPTDSEQPRRPSRNPLIGRTLNNRYDILDVVGSGGMATVFRAHDRRLGRDVAVKILHPQFAADDAFVERFRQEAEFAARLSAHPNIAPIYDVGEDGELSYIVMELVGGGNLKDIISAGGALSVDRAFRIGQQIASALEFAHRRDFVHRDIKPQNVLIAADDSVKVTDFGIARSATATQMTRTGVVMGTAHYISPEQAQGKPATASSDIYALGVVLFEMLTGRLPFDAENPLAVAMKHVHEPPPPPNRLNPAITPAAAAVVLRALNKDPADRYRSAAEFGMAMQHQELPDAGATVVNQPVVVSPPPADTTTVLTQRRVPPPRERRIAQEVMVPPNPWRRTLLILGLVALVLLAAFGGWYAFANAFGTGSTSTPTPTPRATPTPTSTPAPKPTRTPRVIVSIPTATRVPPPTFTPVPTRPPPPTRTPVPTRTPRPTKTPFPSPTAVPTPTSVPPSATPVPTATPFG